MRVLRLLFAASVALVVSACADRPAIQETKLDNGMRVIVKEDHRAPVVVSQVWYKVGSADEPEGLTGISHVLEHMMFKGTKRYGPGEFSRIIAENGGRENAFTSRDYTAYHEQLEKSRLPIALELEADRMHNLLLDEKEFAKEVQVVMEERRMRTEDNPEALVYEQFMATAYPKHPYGQPVIGWMRDLESLTIDDLRRWYARYYTPSNAILVVVGDVNAADVFALAENYFGPIPARAAKHDTPPRPEQSQLRETKVRAPAELPYLLLGFHVPNLTPKTEEEAYALDVLAAVLAGGKSARLPQQLIREQQIAVSADAGYQAVARFPSLLSFDAVPANGRSVSDVRAALLAEAERLKREPISKEELERVKAQVVAEDVYRRDSMFGEATTIGALETVGLSWRLMDEYVARIRAVTPEQVQRVAKKYLVQPNMTVAWLDPLPLASKKRTPRPEQAHVR